ncbi:WD40-repeat-containing domain protein, partial [Nemania sp. FL0031]
MAEVFGVAASALAVAELSVKVISLCLQYSKEVKHARGDIERVTKHVENLETVTRKLNELLRGPHQTQLQASQKLGDTLKGSQAQLRSLHEKLTPRKERGLMGKFSFRALKWPFESKEVEKILRELAGYAQPIITALQIDQTNILLSIDQKTVLNRLPIAEGAAFDSHAEEHDPECLPDTRVDLLREIGEWIDDPAAKAVFWLKGMAGTGKSTISRTLAHTSSKCGQLGASFFFKRGEGDRGGASKFFTTIAAQLVQQEPALAPYVKNVIDTDPAIFGKALRVQFEKLISEPLSKISSPNRTSNVLVVVIDALDECDHDRDIQLIIHLLSHASTLKSPRLRIFLTSRPELHIRLGFYNIQGKYQNIILHEIEMPIIEHDISVYFKQELGRIRIEYNKTASHDQQLQPTWPGSKNLGILIEMAIPLFIFATTACRLLADHRTGTPEVNLGKILEHRTKSQDDKLRAVYIPVLDQLIAGLSETSQTELLALFKFIVGSIVLLANPLSTSALARLLDIRRDVIDNQLNFLHSVLNVPSSSSIPVRLLHLSFRDFLLDPSISSRNPFWVDEKQAHKQLATCCLHAMNKTLRTNVCEVKWPGTLHNSIDPQTVNNKLTPEVKYACQYWIHHLQQAGDHIVDDDEVHHFLQRHFLHWLEALSLIGRVSECLQSIGLLQSLLQSKNCDQVSSFINDAIRFARTNVSTIQSTPLQVYYSSLAFAPEESIIRTTFQNDTPDWISVRPNVDLYWNNCLQVLDGHKGGVNTIAFSPDDTVIASGSGDKIIRLWSSATGEYLQTLDSYTDNISSIAFSSDSRFIAPGSRDNAIRLWLFATGEHLQTFEGHTSAVYSIAFSPDGKVIASGSYDSIIRLWSSATGEHLQTFKGHTDSIHSIAFSPDSRVIASGSSDHTIRLWPLLATRSENLNTPEGHTNSVRSVEISSNGIIVASGSNDNTIKLWSLSAARSECLCTLEGHTDWVRSVAFSSNGTILASGSDDKTIKLWSLSAARSECLYTLEGHRGRVNSVAFSPDGTILASGSADKTIRLWSLSVARSECLYALEGHRGRVNSVAFSPDGTILASGSADETIRLWYGFTSTPNCLRIIDLGMSLYHLSFDSDSQVLRTEAGVISLGDLVKPTPTEDQNSNGPCTSRPDLALANNDEGHLLGYGIRRDRSWITFNGKDLLWLPADFRPWVGTFVTIGSTVAIGTLSGRVVVIQFRAEGPALD